MTKHSLQLKEKKRNYSRLWRLKNKDKQKKYYENNKEKQRIYSRVWRFNNKEKQKKYYETWREKNKEKIEVRGKALKRIEDIN